MNCLACGVLTSRSNEARHRRMPVHRAAVERLGSDPSLRGYGPKAASESEFAARFWSRVEKSEGCWIWAGARQRQGYGKIYRGGAFLVASRVAYELEVGPIPAGHQVCHKCDNPPCVRPDHLFLALPIDNTADMLSKGRMARGSARPGAKLTEDDVRAIRTRLGSTTRRELAEDYGVSEAVIRDIEMRRHWQHV